MKKKERLIGCIIILGVLSSVVFFTSSIKPADDISEEEILEIFNEEKPKEVASSSQNNSEPNNNQEVKSTSIVVEIKGEVKNPNVYTLKEGSRVNELIEMAGGLTELANVDAINRASELADGQCIVVANINSEVVIDEASLNSTVQVSETSSSEKSDIVNINTGTMEDLMTLNGIGEAKATAIIDYRETNGPFNSIDDITNVSGIGDKTLEKIRDNLSI